MDARNTFRSKHHKITLQLEAFVEDLLERGDTNKKVSLLCGLHQRTVKSIDKTRLQRIYTEFAPNGQRVFSKPDRQARYLAIDEFKLHNGFRFATHIIDMQTGHILWISYGKKKQVVYDFIEHVGLEWMDHVEAVACDMNSDFQEAFEERCPHIQPVFDHFHIVKNFNEKVIANVRKDEQKRLESEGKREAAKSLKRSKYILTSSRKTLEQKDQDARDSKVVSKGNTLFNKDDFVRKEGYVERYEDILKENRLLFTADLIKEKLSDAYKTDSESEMAKAMTEIMQLCKGTHNRHFRWFENLIDKHFEGIIAHATYKITSGKVEGINNKIKTLRRQGYGYPDDEYFFLKLWTQVTSATLETRQPP